MQLWRLLYSKRGNKDLFLVVAEFLFKSIITTTTHHYHHLVSSKSQNPPPYLHLSSIHTSLLNSRVSPLIQLVKSSVNSAANHQIECGSDLDLELVALPFWIALRKMKIQCDVCEKAQTTLIYCADEATPCARCDVEVHAANKLASKHQRLLLHTLSNKLLPCDICQCAFVNLVTSSVEEYHGCILQPITQQIKVRIYSDLDTIGFLTYAATISVPLLVFSFKTSTFSLSDTSVILIFPPPLDSSTITLYDGGFSGKKVNFAATVD
ncbi:hypothetical protein L1987_59820 [Smallanthus sonchifolius]|uniref:Uncharacterized protein n=1 Tax=Smallanthus sonchifolius TaxID=185202 RepID=A0ACB9D6I7_9ASTR|nr:hypothetical protein L1987_59820 [Smallanthus sonchifolius]